MNTHELTAFGRNLPALRVKDAKLYTSQKTLLADLQPGDILTTTASKNDHDPKKDPLAWASEAVFKGVSRGLYGERAHTAIYVGDGKVVEMFDKLQKVPLSKAVARRDVWVSRPKVPADVRARAAARADGMHLAVGSEAEYHSPAWLLKLLINDKVDKRLFKGDADKGFDTKKYICSNLVAKAYEGDVAFTDKPTGFHTPTDIATSSQNAPVGTYMNTKRWDKGTRT